MNKKEFIEILAKDLEIDKKNAEKCYNSMFKNLINIVRKEKEFKIIGLGTFSIVRRKERKGINLQTNESIIIPAKDVLKFKVSKKLKDIIAAASV